MDNSANIAPLIRKILSSLAVHPAQPRCPECKTMMQHVDGLFWVIDAQPRWEVSLPFCANCEPELLCRDFSPAVN
jgi:hypothetical protein